MAAFISDDNLNILIDEKLDENEEIEALLKKPLSNLDLEGILPNPTYVWDDYVKNFLEGANEKVEEAADKIKTIAMNQKSLYVDDGSGGVIRNNRVRDKLRFERTSYNELKQKLALGKDIVRERKDIVSKRKDIFSTYIEKKKRWFQEFYKLRMEIVRNEWNRDLIKGMQGLKSWKSEIIEESKKLEKKIYSTRFSQIKCQTWRITVKDKFPPQINSGDLGAFKSIVDPLIEYFEIEMQLYSELRDVLGVLMRTLIPAYMRLRM